MEQFEDASSVNTTSDFIAEMMMDEKDGEEFTLEYLKARFLSSVGRSLYYARRQAGLTQAQVAERMNTTQSAIARFEADKNGAMSFHRYVDFAIACGLMPHSLVLHPILEPIDSLRDEVIARAESRSSLEPPQAITVDNIKAHLAGKQASPTGPTPLTNQNAKAAIETAENTVERSRQQYLGQDVTTASSSRRNERMVFA